MPFDPNSLIYFSLIFFIIGTGIQIVAMLRAKTRASKDEKPIQAFLAGHDPMEVPRRTNDPIVLEKVDEQTFRKIDRIMKDGY